MAGGIGTIAGGVVVGGSTSATGVGLAAGAGMVITGFTGTILGGCQVGVGLWGGSMEEAPQSYTGMMLMPAGKTASRMGDAAEAIATGAANPLTPGPLGATQTTLQVLNAINPFSGSGKESEPLFSSPLEPGDPGWNFWMGP